MCPGRYRPRMTSISFKRHRFPLEIVRHSVRLGGQFTPSYRDVEERLAERRNEVSNETVVASF